MLRFFQAFRVSPGCLGKAFSFSFSFPEAEAEGLLAPLVARLLARAFAARAVRAAPSLRLALALGFASPEGELFV